MRGFPIISPLFSKDFFWCNFTWEFSCANILASLALFFLLWCCTSVTWLQFFLRVVLRLILRTNEAKKIDKTKGKIGATATRLARQFRFSHKKVSNKIPSLLYSSFLTCNCNINQVLKRSSSSCNEIRKRNEDEQAIDL